MNIVLGLILMFQAALMPHCANRCTWNAGAATKDQCWTYLGTGATQGQVVGYFPGQTVNGQVCSWTYYLKSDKE